MACRLIAESSVLIFFVILAYFDIRIHVVLLSIPCRCIIGLCSVLLIWCRLRFLYCAGDQFWVGVMSVIYRFQIGWFQTESYPKWPWYGPACFVVSTDTFQNQDWRLTDTFWTQNECKPTTVCDVTSCAGNRFWVVVMSVIYRSQIGRFHTEYYPK